MDNSIKNLGPGFGGAIPLKDPLKNSRTDSNKVSQKETEKPSQGQSVAFKDLLESQFDREAAKPAAAAAQASQASELKFSAHAKSRLNSRGIELSAEDLLKMQEAVKKAGDKGSKESLILTDKAAFVVSVKNNTVITAVDKDSLKENVFTNIDSTVWI